MVPSSEREAIMSMVLVLTFCSVVKCEEYQIDYNLTRSDCIERMKEEREFIMSLPLEEAYQEYMENFKAEHMDGEVVDWEMNCVKDK